MIYAGIMMILRNISLLFGNYFENKQSGEWNRASFCGYLNYIFDVFNEKGDKGKCILRNSTFKLQLYKNWEKKN